MLRAIKLFVRFIIACMVRQIRPRIANIGPNWVAMLKDAATIKAAPVQEIKPIIRSTPRR